MNIPGEIPIGCKWSPSLSKVKDGITLKTKGTCHYRAKVDPNNLHEPICKPKYCPEKTIPNSNRDNLGTNKPLPGPKNMLRNHGECINSVDSTVYPNITNALDCLCYKHSSCKTCNNDTGCQWCGDNKGVNNQGEGNAGCYSIKTSQPICNNDTIGLSGKASCVTRGSNPSSKPGWNTMKYEQQKETKCKGTIECFNQHGDVIPTSGPQRITLEKIRDNYKKSKKYKGDTLNAKQACKKINSDWTPDNPIYSGSEVKSYCYFNNNITKSSLYAINNEFGLYPSPSNISIAPYYCKPIKGEDDPGKCYKHTDIGSCAEPTCTWKENKFNDDNVKWTSRDGYKDKIRIWGGAGKKCFLCNDTITAKECKSSVPLLRDSPPTGPNSSTFTVSHVESGKYIKLSHGNVGDIKIDPSAPTQCSIQYLDTGNASANNVYNLQTALFHDQNQIHTEPYDCKGGIKYCVTKSDYCDTEKKVPVIRRGGDEKTCDASSEACKGDIPIKCLNEAGTGVGDNLKGWVIKDSYNFYSDTYKKVTDESKCLDTSYHITSNPSTYPQEYDSKVYANCGITAISDHDKPKICKYINKKYKGREDTTHWGRYCKKGNEKVSVKDCM